MSTVRSHTSSDGRHRVDFDANAAGFVRFTELVWHEEPAPWDEAEMDRYWGFGRQSGLYPSVQEAALAAEQQLDWFEASSLDNR